MISQNVNGTLWGNLALLRNVCNPNHAGHSNFTRGGSRIGRTEEQGTEKQGLAPCS